jgi:hypothetical protein
MSFPRNDTLRLLWAEYEMPPTRYERPRIPAKTAGCVFPMSSPQITRMFSFSALAIVAWPPSVGRRRKVRTARRTALHATWVNVGSCGSIPSV